MKTLSEIKKLLLAHPDIQTHIAAMAATPQDKIHHAEGDVWTHTQMVMSEAEKIIAEDGLDEEKAIQLWLAAFFHDIAKPLVTVEDEHGRISAAGHARRGAHIAYAFLAQAGVLSQEQLYALYMLVKYHGRPLWVNDPRRDLKFELIQLSQQVSIPAMYRLVQADVKGRRCADMEELELKLEIFREESEKMELWERLFTFPDPHTRFMYNKGKYAAPEYGLYDDTGFEVYLMCGLPGSGKDTWIKRNMPEEMQVISLDALRKKHGWQRQKDWPKAAQLAKDTAQELCRKGRSFIWNATFHRQQLRQQAIDLVHTYKGRVHIIFMDTPWQQVLQQNRSREAMIPEKNLLDMLQGFELPEATEAYSLQFIH